MFGVDDLAIAGLALGGVSSIANFGLGLANYRYQKNLQNEIFRREDNSIARRVHDLKASGLSPVLAAGQGAATGAIVSTKPPEIDPTLAASLFIQLSTMQKDFQVKDKQLQVLQSQKKLNDITTAIKTWDLKQYIKSGTASNASGLAKTIRDLFGMSNSPLVKSVKDDIYHKLGIPTDEEIKSRTDQRIKFDKERYDAVKNMTPAQRKEYEKALESEQERLIEELNKGFFQTIFN